MDAPEKCMGWVGENRVGGVGWFRVVQWVVLCHVLWLICVLKSALRLCCISAPKNKWKNMWVAEGGSEKRGVSGWLGGQEVGQQQWQCPKFMCIASVKLFLHTQIRAHANEYAGEHVCACSARDGMFPIRSYHLKLKRKTILKKNIYLNMLFTIYK